MAQIIQKLVKILRTQSTQDVSESEYGIQDFLCPQAVTTMTHYVQDLNNQESNIFLQSGQCSVVQVNSLSDLSYDHAVR
jgi:hypothetical protein